MATTAAFHNLLASVRTSSAGVAQSERAIVTSAVPSHLDAFNELAKNLERAGRKGEVQQVRAAVESLINVDAGIQRHADAVQRVPQHYAAPEERSCTDFRAAIEARMAEQPEAGSAEEDGRLAEFDSAVRSAAGGEQRELDEDEDLRIDEANTSLAPNNQCPISGKPIMELEEPVEDLKGFVYEKADIERFMNGQQSIPCPVSGTSHTVSVGQLRPARAIIKAQSRAQRNPGAQAHRSGDDVLDVE